MNTTKVCSSGARRAGIWQLLALCGVLIAAGLLGVALATVPPAEASASGPPDDRMFSDFLRASDVSARGVGASTPADSFPCTGDGVYLYDDINYGGACLRWTADDPELGDDSFHDRASSLRFVGYYASGARATLYEHHSYTGASTTFTADDPWLGDDAIGNDRADSIRIEMVPFCDLVSEIPKVECEALVAFYNSTDGPHWTNRNGWLVTNTPCTTPWVGVQCAGGRVRKLHLFWNGLNGAIPPQLGSLSNLRELYLVDNLQLRGTIPPQLGNLTNLEGLYLSMNQLSGTIPAQLGNLTDLRELSLTSTQLNGAIPPQLGNLTKLEWLQLDHSSLSGALPGDMKQFTALKTFHFDHTLLCEPADPAFQAWLASIPDLHSTGVKCPASTVTPTPTVTRTRTPSPTATRTGGSTPSPTPTPTATRAPLPCSNLLRNGDFEAGLLAPWMTDLQVGLGPGRGIGHGGWLGGAINTEAELFQEVMIPAPANLGKLTFWWRADAANAQPGDRLAVLIQYGEESDPVWSQAADGAPGQWRRQEVDLSAYRGRRVFVTFHAHNDAGVATTFRVDDVDLPICRSGLYLPLVLRSNPAAIPILSDNFNDGDVAGWAPNGGVWQNTGSALRGQRTGGVGYNMRLESGTDFTYEATVTVHSGAAGLTFRSSADGADSDCVALDPAAGRVKFCINGPWWYGAAREMALQYNRAYRLKVVARAASFEVYLDGDKLFTTTSTRHAAGRFGVLVYEGTASFDDVVASSP